MWWGTTKMVEKVFCVCDGFASSQGKLVLTLNIFNYLHNKNARARW